MRENYNREGKLIAFLAIVMGLSIAAIAGSTGWKATARGSFTGGSFVYTNTTGNKLSAAMITLTSPSGEFGGTNVIIRMSNVASSTNILSDTSTTNNVIVRAGEPCILIETSGRILFNVGCTSVVYWEVYPINY